MKRRLARDLTITLCTVVSLVGSVPTLAAPRDDVARSRQHASAGLELFNRGKYADAYDEFYVADQLGETPQYALYMARCKAKLGELKSARELYRRVATHQLRDDAPAPWRRAQTDAKTELKQIEQKIPKLVVQTDPKDLDVTLDGRPVLAAVLASPIAVDPGEHRLAGIRGDRRVDVKVVVAAGQGTVPVELTLAAVPDARAAKGPLWPGVLLTSVGVASLAAGAVVGGLALSLDADLQEACPGGACPDASVDDADRLDTYEVVSTTTLIAGGVLAAAGVTLWVLRPGGEENEAAAGVGVVATPTSLVLRGRF